MGKFLLGLATGLLLVFLTVVLIFFAAWRFRDRPPDIADNSVLVLRLQGEIPEKPPVEMPAFLGGDGPRLTVTGFWMTLRKAAADTHIKAVVLEPERLAAGWAKLEEMRSDLRWAAVDRHRLLDDAAQGRRGYAYQSRGAGAGKACGRLGEAGRDAGGSRPIPQVGQAGLRIPADAGNARILPGHGGRSHLPGRFGPGDGEGAASGADVLQEDLGQAGRGGGSGARGQVQRLWRYVHALRYERRNPRRDEPPGGRPLRQPGGEDCGGTEEDAGRSQEHDRSGPVHGHAGAKGRPGGRAEVRRRDVGRAERPAENGRTPQGGAGRLPEGAAGGGGAGRQEPDRAGGGGRRNRAR